MILKAYQYRMNAFPDKICYDDCQRILFHIKHHNATIPEYLEGLLKVENENAKGQIFSELITYWAYDDLKEILPFYIEQPITDRSFKHYLYDDFGLFIPNYTKDSLVTLLENINAMSEEGVYLHYLKMAGLDLDFSDTLKAYQQIYQALKFDYYIGFTSSYYPSHMKTLLSFLGLHFKNHFSANGNDINTYFYFSNQVVNIRQVRWLHFFEQQGYADEALLERKAIAEWLFDTYIDD